MTKPSWYLQPTCRPDEARIELLEVTRAAGGMKGLLRWASEVARRQGAQHIGIDRRYNDELRTLRLAGFREVGAHGLLYLSRAFEAIASCG